MRRLFCILAILLFFGGIATAQTAAVIRNVNLRPDPSTQNAPLAKLTPGTHLKLLDPEPTGGFLHVKTADGNEGWVWSRNVHVEAASGPSSVRHVGPAWLYPDPAKTPGLAATLKVADLTQVYTEHCPKHKATCTYSQSHRHVSRSEHNKIYDEYDVPQARRNFKSGEVDHFYPLCAGGSNDIANLWYQPAVNEWKGEDFGYHAKDKLEAYICVEIKAGRLDPKQAYDRITSDWVKFYLDEGLNDTN